MEYSLHVDTVDCIGCYTCEVACKQEHNLPVGPRLIRVYSDGPQQIDGKIQLRYRVELCRHCDSPKCVESCTTDAIIIRADGIAIIDEELCNGCGNCIEACPYGMMQFDHDRKVALKCDLCAERLDIGLKPACVNSCPSHCIHLDILKT